MVCINIQPILIQMIMNAEKKTKYDEEKKRLKIKLNFLTITKEKKHIYETGTRSMVQNACITNEETRIHCTSMELLP